MRGYYTPYVPGWDNHGMPIGRPSSKKEQIKPQDHAHPEFRSACQAFAQDYIDRQMASFKRMGVMGDWEHPYKTMNKRASRPRKSRSLGRCTKRATSTKGVKACVLVPLRTRPPWRRRRLNIRTTPAPRCM